MKTVCAAIDLGRLGHDQFAQKRFKIAGRDCFPQRDASLHCRRIEGKGVKGLNRSGPCELRRQQDEFGIPDCDILADFLCQLGNQSASADACAAASTTTSFQWRRSSSTSASIHC